VIRINSRFDAHRWRKKPRAHVFTAAVLADPAQVAACTIGQLAQLWRGELCALRWSDVDWTRSTLKISRRLTVLNRDPSENPTKTHRRRDIAIRAALGAFLSYMRTQQRGLGAQVSALLRRLSSTG
jgi:integrase